MNVDRYVIGIDVGGTNTDGVLVHNDVIIERHKTTTSEDIKKGISEVLQQLFKSNQSKLNQISINIGTTHLLNAFLERKGLNKILVVRLGFPISNALPSTIGWGNEAKDLKDLVGKCCLIRGGYQYNKGEIVEIEPLDVAEIEKIGTRDLER